MSIVIPKSLGFTPRWLPQHGHQKMITKRGFRGWVLHTAVSNGRSIYNVFANNSVESTVYVRKDGTGEQMMWVDERADCQVDGNWWWDEQDGGSGFASMETWDGAGTSVWPDYNKNPSGGPAWTSEQIESITDLIAWSSRENVLDFPIQIANGARGYGIGWHNKYTNTEPYEWNSSHACPGKRRIAQVPGIVSLAKKKANPVIPVPKPTPAPPPPKESDDVALTQDDVYTLWTGRQWKELVDEGADGDRDERTPADILYTTHKNTVQLEAKVDDLKAEIQQLRGLIQETHSPAGESQ
jgi:hypothetical protein